MEDSHLPQFEGQVTFDKRGSNVNASREDDKS